MKFPPSLRILIFFAVLIGMIGVGKPSPIHAAGPLTFDGHLYDYGSNTHPQFNDSDWYTVYVQAGETVELALSYTTACVYMSSYLDVSIGGTQVDSILFQYPISPPYPPIFVLTVSETKTYSRVMPNTEAVQIGLVLRALNGLPGDHCDTGYEMAVSGATLTPPLPIMPPDPILAAEEAAGLHRVHANALPVVIYTPTPANPDRFIDIRDLEGNPLLYISADEIATLPEFPDENTLIASEGLISVYKLTTGEYQVNVGPLPDGKVHVIIFDSIPRTHTYGYTWSPSAD